MGVPKFYRWISERFPCLSETVKEFQIPEFDNLYLDMNGIIHVCSHPEDDNPHFRITEEKIFSDIFHYIDFLFRMIKPKKVFYMAVDGVAPRAKMNQQRGRRFRSAREAEELIKKAKEKGETLPTEKRFDSNCITPGTEFMVRLQENLKYFVVQKISSDPLWQGVRVFLSGHETPGEGEHKIMDFIRYEKSQPGYDHNTRHVLHGLDADLMILGMATHEPHFSLLREEVRFGGRKDKNKRPNTPEETTFHLLHLSLLREYLDYEFGVLKNKLPFPYDLESIIDDWILMGFLVGNDFIPHLPNLHINHDALPYLWRTYEEVMPTLDGYINEGGHLNLPRFEKYLACLAKFDIEKFSDQFSDMKWLEGKVGKKPINEAAARAAQEEREKKEKKKALNNANPFAPLDGVSEEFSSSPEWDDSGVDPFTDPLDEPSLSDLSDEDSDTFDAEFRQHKRNYYMDKLDYPNVTHEVLRDQAEGYVRAIQWILLYYHEGVPSWSWFYPHHYAPYISDVKGFSNMRITFDLGTPFLPFQQLMAVLPAASRDLLPEAFRDLMTMDYSPVIDFYPVNFKTDLNGKQQDWEAVVLIPFIEEARLLAAMQPKYQRMSKSETARNSHGPSTMFYFSPETQQPYLSPTPEVFPDINNNHTKTEVVPLDKYRIDGNRMRKGLLPEVRLEVYFPGFPTLKHIKHTAERKREGVKVFQMNSRGDNMVLTITEPESGLSMDLEQATHELLGKCVYVGWPHLYEAKVVEICDGETKFLLQEHRTEKSRKSTFEKISRQISREEQAIWKREAGSIKERYHDRLGINIGHTDILLYALPMTGRKYTCGAHGKITLDKQFSLRPVPFALQASVKDIAVHDPTFQQFKTLDELFAKDTTVFMMGQPHFGSEGQVIEIEDGRVRVNFTVIAEPNMEKIQYRQDTLETRYMPGYMIAQRAGISGYFLSRLTGNLMILQGRGDSPNANRVNVGLNLKHTKHNQELPGYTKKVEDKWYYSEATLELVQEYIDKFDSVVSVLGTQEHGSDMLTEEDLFPAGSGKKLRDLQEFLKSLPSTNVNTMSVGAEILEEGVVKAIEKEVALTNEENKRKQKKAKMQVKPHLLFKPLLNQGSLVPDQTATYELYDRVVVVKMGYPVPLGMRGTVIGIHPGEKESDTMYDVVFDQEFVGGIKVRCSPSRGYRVSGIAVINISHANRKEQGGQSRPSFRPMYDNWTQQRSSPKNTSYSGMMQRGSEGHAGRAPFMQWGEADRRQREDTGPRHQYNSYNGSRGSYGQGQGQVQRKTEFVNGVEKHPQFVTPKLQQSSKWTPSRNQPRRGEEQSLQESGSSEFANMWKELQAGTGKTATPGGASTLGSSLQQAALALGQITPPSKDTLQKDQPPTDAGSSETRKIDLQTLFDRASLKKDETENSEFIAMMDSLQMSDKNKSTTEKMTNDNNTDHDEDGSSALKSMLKIGSDEGSPPEGNTSQSAQVTAASNYGRQLSVQELFDGAKQQEKSSNQTKPESKSSPKQQQNHQPPQQQNNQLPQQQQQHHQQQQQPQQHLQQQQQHQQQQYKNQGQKHTAQHPGHPIPRSAPEGPPRVSSGNPVLDLEAKCRTMGLGAPMYDYKRVQGLFKSMVILPNGVLFEGSQCNTKGEAAESAASFALLHLQALDSRKQRPHFMNIPPPGMMRNPPPPRHLSSANSAFSPVTPGAQPMFMPRGGYSRHPYPGLPPQPHQFPGGPPPHQMHRMHGGHRPHHPAGQTAVNHHHGNPPEPAPTHHPDPVKRQTSVTDPAFIPLQVARNQKTPQKRKDPVEAENATTARDFNDNASSRQTDQGSVRTDKYTAHRSAHSHEHRTESKSSGSQSQGKKRRPRIAANLNFT